MLWLAMYSMERPMRSRINLDKLTGEVQEVKDLLKYSFKFY